MSADTDMVDLKPCPFCGGEPALALAPCPEPIAYVTCECGANGADFFETDDGDEYAAKAITAWNTRAALDASGIGEMVEALQKCRDKFAEYVELHAVKLQGAQPTYAVKEIEAKVARNQAMVDLCDAALSRARAAVGNKDG
jgi:Lar family restriction alleviation protein